jgi:NMD protein affecting ribosome stability and mRNA decay
MNGITNDHDAQIEHLCTACAATRLSPYPVHVSSEVNVCRQCLLPMTPRRSEMDSNR